MKGVDGRTEGSAFLLVRQDVDKGHWKDTLPFRLSFDMPDPPLLVLFPGDNDHFPLNKCEFVVIICLAVINGLHPPHFIFPLQLKKEQV